MSTEAEVSADDNYDMTQLKDFLINTGSETKDGDCENSCKIVRSLWKDPKNFDPSLKVHVFLNYFFFKCKFVIWKRI